MPPVVIDASALVDALVSADAEIVQSAIGARSLLAPAHLDAEVLSALRGLVRGGHLTAGRCRDSLGDLGDLTLTRWPLPVELMLRALDLSHSITAYDALYVALAEIAEVPLLTRDGRLARAAEPFIEVEVV